MASPGDEAGGTRATRAATHPRLTGRRLLGIFPHPDDEAYAAAGTLARCVDDGAAVALATATRGEAGAVVFRQAVGDQPLGQVRAAELARACAHIGATGPVFLGAADGRVADHAALDDRIRAAIAEHDAEVVITLGNDGVYGHRDHLAVTAAVGRVVSALDASAPRVLHAAFPRGLFGPVFEAMKRYGVALSQDSRAEGLGVARSEVDLCIDIRGVAERKLAAVAAHASQLPGGDPRRFLVPGLIDALLTEEWFTVAAGPPLPPSAEDPFAGL